MQGILPGYKFEIASKYGAEKSFAFKVNDKASANAIPARSPVKRAGPGEIIILVISNTSLVDNI